MSPARLVSILVALAAAVLLHAGPANAQASRTWVSGVGDDVNPCSRTAPCKTFAGAISKTAAGGIINCLDPAGFGAVTVTKSITIDCLYNGPSGILAAGTSGVIVNAAATDRVTLRGLSIEGFGTGLYGVNILQAGTVLVDRCRIFGFKTNNGTGIRLAVNGTSELHVKDSVIHDNGSGTTGGGIVLAPTGAVDVRGWFSRVELRDNSYGLHVNGAGGASGYVRISGVEVDAAGNMNDGLRVAAGGAAAAAFLDRSQLMGNGSYGAIATGAGGYALLGRSTIVLNGQGLGTATGGMVLSYGNNQLNANGVDGVPSGVLTEK